MNPLARPRSNACQPARAWRLLLAAAAFMVALGLSTGARSAAPEPPPPTPAAAPAAPAPAEATLKVFNRDIVTFRATALGLSPTDRARRAEHRIAEQLALPGPHRVTQLDSPIGMLVQIDGKSSFFVTTDDTDLLNPEPLANLSGRTVQALVDAIDATREGRRTEAILRASAVAVAATAAMLVLFWLYLRARLAIEGWLVRVTHRHAERLRVSGVALIQRERLVAVVHGVLVMMHGLLSLLLVYGWASLVLAQFPYTRVWGDKLNGHLIGLVTGIAGSIVDAVPGLVTAVLIFFLTRFAVRLLDGFFDRVQAGQVRLGWLAHDVVAPTRRIAKGALWLFALAMAYPYLPGSHTEAFKGLSVLVGLMISIGSSNLIGHAGSGLILTYARVFRQGEFVRIGDHEGTVTELGVFATRLRTGMGEEVTLSNSVVLGAVTKNYSRTVKGVGFILDTTVTIGYDTPWRQVHELLAQAALRTPGVLVDPAPQVFQTALSDFYPEYRLVCQAVPSAPVPRAQVLSTLHANIQDLFNEHGVQIMSPHYLGDPAEAKVVPKGRWFTPPARGPQE